MTQAIQDNIKKAIADIDARIVAHVDQIKAADEAIAHWQADKDSANEVLTLERELRATYVTRLREMEDRE